MSHAPSNTPVPPGAGRARGVFRGWSCGLARELSRGLALGLMAASACLLSACGLSPSAPPEQLATATPAARATLAPTGVLRVGVYAGSPLSLIEHADPARNAGLSHDLGRELARWLDVPFELARFDRLADLMIAMAQGEVDFTVTWKSDTYGRDVNYSLPLLDLELGYLAAPGSRLREASDLNALASRQGGVKIGVLRGAGAQAPLARRHPQIEIVPLNSYSEAAERLAARRIDAFAASKSVLYPMAERLGGGARVLNGRWGLETVAIAVPKGRQTGMSYLSRFVLSMRREGGLQTAVRRADLRGAVEPAIR
jgi:polar amino acid transport system substrate-binding protein